jgi:hypothetical protein
MKFKKEEEVRKVKGSRKGRILLEGRKSIFRERETINAVKRDKFL